MRISFKIYENLHKFHLKGQLGRENVIEIGLRMGIGKEGLPGPSTGCVWVCQSGSCPCILPVRTLSIPRQISHSIIIQLLLGLIIPTRPHPWPQRASISRENDLRYQQPATRCWPTATCLSEPSLNLPVCSWSCGLEPPIDGPA